MNRTSAASQHAAALANSPISPAACVAQETPEAEPKTAGGELRTQWGTSAVFIGGSMQQQERRQGHQQQQQDWLEQHDQRGLPENDQTGRRQEDEEEEQQQLHGAKRRRVCSGCNRPCSVCYCSIIQGRDLSLSEQSISSIVNRVIIFMHPLEKKRKNGSVRVLQRLVKGVEIWPHRRPGCCPFAAESQYIQQGGEDVDHEKQRKEVMEGSEGPTRTSEAAASSERLEEACAADCGVEDAAAEGCWQQQQRDHQEEQPHPKQQQQQQHLCTRDGVAVCDTSRMILLFPTESSLALGTGSLPVRLPVTLLAIDGTWKEAKEMFSASPWLQQLPAVHLPIRQNVHDSSVCFAAAGTNTAYASASCCSSSMDAAEALRVSGAYGMIRTPPANVAARGGVCTAEAIAQALSVFGRWGRSGSSSLLQIGETTRETLQRIVSVQQRMRDENRKRKLIA